MKNIKPKDIEKHWHLIDAEDKVVGRLASDVAQLLMGKHKSYFTPHLDTGDFVVIVNAKTAKFTGKKEQQKKYYRHSGYPGGLYTKTAAQVRQVKSQDLLKNAVRGMLPKTKLGKLMLKKLFVYEDSEHPYKNKFK